MKKFTLEIEAVNNGYRVRISDSEREIFTGIADNGLPFSCTVSLREFQRDIFTSMGTPIPSTQTERGVMLKMEGAHLPYYVPL